MTDQTNADVEVKALFLGTMAERPRDVALLVETVQYESKHPSISVIPKMS
jgi:hypothetical protein